MEISAAVVELEPVECILISDQVPVRLLFAITIPYTADMQMHD